MGEILSLLLTHPGAGEHMHTGTPRAVGSCSAREQVGVSSAWLEGPSSVVEDVGECCTTTFPVHIICIPVWIRTGYSLEIRVKLVKMK